MQTSRSALGSLDIVEIDVDDEDQFLCAKTVRRGGRVVGGIFINQTELSMATQRDYAETLEQPDQAGV